MTERPTGRPRPTPTPGRGNPRRPSGLPNDQQGGPGAGNGQERPSPRSAAQSFQSRLAAAASEFKQAATASSQRPGRRVRLRQTRVDPWSVMKVAFLLSVALGVVSVVAVIIVWSVLSGAGVWNSINDSVRNIVGDGSGSTFNVTDYVGLSRVLGFTMVIAAIEVVLLTAIATP